MSEAAAIDLDHLRGWIGREEVATDLVTADLVAKFNATFDAEAPFPAEGDIAPRFIHFCLTQAIVPMRGLGRDGGRTAPAAACDRRPDRDRHRQAGRDADRRPRHLE